MSEPASFGLTARFDRRLAWWRGGSVRYVVAEVAAPATPASARPDHMLALALDLSVANPSVLAAMRALVDGLARRLGQRDRLAVVSYARAPVVHATGGPAHVVAAVSRTLAPRPGGCDLAEGWLAAAEEAARVAPDRRDLRRSVVVASAAPADAGMRAPEDLMRHANALYGRGISTIGVGIGPRCDIPALVAIDDHHGASSRMSTATDDLAEIIAADRLGLAGEAAAEARLIVDLPEGASAAVIGLKPDPAEDGRLSVPLGPMLAGARRAVTIRVTLPSGEPGTKLPVSVGFEWYGAADDEPRRLAPVALDVELATGSNNSPQCRDEAASLLALEQWRWALMSEIVRLNRDGRLREATEHLESEMKHLERYARALPQGSALVDQLRLALAVVHRPWRRHRAETADI